MPHMTATLTPCPESLAALESLRALHADVCRHLAARQAEHGVIIDIQSVRCEVARTHCLLVEFEAALTSSNPALADPALANPALANPAPANTSAKITAEADATYAASHRTPAGHADASDSRTVAALAWRLYFQLMFLGGARYFEQGTPADDAWSAITTLRKKVAEK